MANNRMLHPSERELARYIADRAREQGLNYSVEQIEEQMRLMGNDLYGVRPNHAELYADVINDPAALQRLQDSIAQDPGMARRVSGNTVYEVLATPDVEIQRYITENSQHGAAWIPGSSPYVPSVDVRVVTGFTLPTAKCANGDFACASGVGTNASPPLTPEERRIVGEYFGRVSADYHRAAALAQATGNTQVTVAFEIAAGVAAILEQMFIPSTGKVLIDSAVDIAAREFSTRTGIPLALVNEVVEREIKPNLQDLKNLIDDEFRESHED